MKLRDKKFKFEDLDLSTCSCTSPDKFFKERNFNVYVLHCREKFGGYWEIYRVSEHEVYPVPPTERVYASYLETITSSFK